MQFHRQKKKSGNNDAKWQDQNNNKSSRTNFWHAQSTKPLPFKHRIRWKIEHANIRKCQATFDRAPFLPHIIILGSTQVEKMDVLLLQRLREILNGNSATARSVLVLQSML